MKVTFPTALFLLFLALKLTGYIDWSWWWVTAPMWIPAGGAVVAILIFVLARTVVHAFESKESKAARALREYGEALSKRR